MVKIIEEDGGDSEYCNDNQKIYTIMGNGQVHARILGVDLIAHNGRQQWSDSSAHLALACLVAGVSVIARCFGPTAQVPRGKVGVAANVFGKDLFRHSSTRDGVSGYGEGGIQINQIDVQDLWHNGSVSVYIT